ncbi:MAG: Glyoxalase/bleomycin resistance protein/dioxygenase [Acidobacteria bacterium]|nr:Glyoxalase/bleomycin resistance protein/dioxygenase [Acidobacteriota bacterium]
MHRRTLCAAALVALFTSTAAPRLGAQLAAPGDSGVVMGHLHLAVKDLEAQRTFWAALGGTPVQNGPLALIQFPGTFVMLRQAQPTGGTVGSTINHVGFLAKDLAPWIAKWQAAGLKMEPQARPTQVYLIGPDDVRVEILEDKTIDVPLKMHHLHFYVASPLETQAWYARTFGAAPGKRGQFDAADLPGVNLTFAKADTPTVATKGRALDHIGFEVKNLDAFCRKLEASGITLDRPYTKIPNSTTAIAFLTDPWGTYIELTENLAPMK